MGFSFDFTCPVINKGIKNIKEQVSDSIINLISDVCPLLSGQDKDYLVEAYVNEIYENFESCFEDTRSSNEEIRSAAEQQIHDTNLENESLRDEIKDLRDRIEELEDKISELEF